MYRTPQLEEFVDGFKIEVYVNKSWIPITYKEGQFTKDVLKRGIEYGREIFRAMVIRVKAY